MTEIVVGAEQHWENTSLEGKGDNPTSHFTMSAQMENDNNADNGDQQVQRQGQVQQQQQQQQQPQGAAPLSIHERLLLAGKDFEHQQNKPKGKHRGEWKTSVTEATYGSESATSRKSEMSSSYARNNEWCTIF